MSIIRVLKNTSFSMLVILFLMFMLSTIGFCFRISINLSYPIISFILGILVLFFSLKKSYKFKKEFYISISVLFLIFIISLICASNFYDFSWDGKTYHQAAIVLLKNGWNPIYDNIETFASNYYNTKLYNLIWVENYPKYVEIIQANIYKLFNNIETAKLTNFVLATVLFMYSYSVMSKNYFIKINKFFKIFISLILVLNPVYVAQCMTFCIDGYVYLYFMLILFAIIDIETNQTPDYIAYSILTISAISIANVKAGGLLYLLVTLLIYFVYLVIFKNRQRIFLLLISVTFISLLFLVSAINPYITNICKDRHPFYPLQGNGKIDVITFNSPKQFVNSFYLKNLYISTFSKVDNIAYNSEEEPFLKLPFYVYRSELPFLGSPDTRICGFGVFWSGIIILSSILIFFIKYKTQQDLRLFILIFAILFILTIINPYSWWARYVPHLWVIPIFICVSILIRENPALFTKITTYLVLALMFINVVIQIPYVLKEERHNRKNINNMIFLVKKHRKNIKIFSVYDYSLIEKFKNSDVKVELVSNSYYEQHRKEFLLIPNAVMNNMFWCSEE